VSAKKKAITLDDLRVQPGGDVAAADLPHAAVVVLNYNGQHHLAGCFESLRALDYPADKLSAILVDNGSTDGSLATMRADHAWVQVVENEVNLGFSVGCNQGAEHASGAGVVVFLNNDMRVEPLWLRELVAPIVRGECASTTAKMLSWDGKKMNSAGGGMNFHGIGIQHGYNATPGAVHDEPRRTLFACGGAMAVDRAVFLDVGGFDAEFFAYYEDVDLGWRMWVLGHEVHYVPGAVCYHHHSSTSRTFPLETVRLLQVRNPVLACVKNYDDGHLGKVLPVLLALYLRRMRIVSGLGDETPFRIEHAGPARTGFLERLLAGAGAKPAQNGQIEISRVAAADLIGINDLLGRWGHWMARRAEVQSRRERADEDIFRLFLKPLWCIEGEPAYRELQDGLADLTGLQDLFAGLDLLGPDPHAGD
jgi:GT2 family glycosyltransferase